ncbi:hypothetical protein HMPREF9699_02111 [Bergeyella zoohelcum ATCC 43767]|uniref:Uncharacterized protein n=1 Tax=Bergeyella zoohelcum ATCC 43767 TaxID=883096 RepID=K1LVN6_9FLAO|nr:hypothetical protein HMPREF9699_02111 [Bergeyella zoohelcum ATCC 43767]SUV65512.1 Uncharacterised protein [Bergeyella zoohelcum]
MNKIAIEELEKRLETAEMAGASCKIIIVVDL